MVGFRMPDGVVFLADCISSKETLEKYAVSFIYDVGAYLETLGMVEKMEAPMFVPAHAEASADMKGLVCYNRDKVHEATDRILSICREYGSFLPFMAERDREIGSYISGQYDTVAEKTVDFLHRISSSHNLNPSVPFFGGAQGCQPEALLAARWRIKVVKSSSL